MGNEWDISDHDEQDEGIGRTPGNVMYVQESILSKNMPLYTNDVLPQVQQYAPDAFRRIFPKRSARVSLFCSAIDVEFTFHRDPKNQVKCLLWQQSERKTIVYHRNAAFAYSYACPQFFYCSIVLLQVVRNC